MIDFILIFLSGLLLLIALIGCFLPILPGPPIGYLGLLLLQLKSTPPFDMSFMVVMFLITAIITAADYLIPIVGAKKFGGSKSGIYGSIIGLIVGMVFFPPIGIIVGPMIGAILGELVIGKKRNEALKSGVGTFVGFILGTLLKVIICGVMGYFMIINL